VSFAQNKTKQSTVAASLPTIANVGQLFYNPNPNSYASLFFPAAGNRYDGPPLNGGALFGMGDYGFYWSSSANQTNSAWALAFIKSVTYPNDLGRSYGFNIRCVKE